MFEDTLELAENKLLLLYIFKRIKFPISNNEITQIILENDFINYFTLQQYLNELLSSNFIKKTAGSNNHKFVITKKGLRVLVLFGNRISKGKIDTIEHYLNTKIKNIKKNLSINANYTVDPKNNFTVDLKISENNSTLMNIKLNVDSNKKAKELCKKWEKNYSDLYYNIVELLMRN
ncbi:DUF4364 family protein [Clostridium sp. Mt-5]|uniref:DUF4364 family protein n=1 Tax=Clostridium moutaii TaxID=3240932 RepID=A0ABV4BTM1_9CLOT